MTQFQIPAPYKAWCHLCNRGFMSLDEATQHDRENVNLHQQMNQEKDDAKTSTQS